MLLGLNEAKLNTCDHWVVGKQRRLCFKHHSSSRKDEVFELVYSNFCGPLKVKSIGGALYFVTFIDDYSRKLWVRTLKTKDQIFIWYIDIALDDAILKTSPRYGV